MNKTGIEYLDYTWNPVTGCTPVSAGCEHCWAKRMHERGLWGKYPFSQSRFHPDRIDEPRKRTKPARIGVAFMGDLFHERFADDVWDEVFAVMAECPEHTFLVLTKRPQRMQRWLSRMEWNLGDGEKHFYLPNVWLGVSVEDQSTADERIPLLLRTPAALRYVSIEPMLAPVNISKYLPAVNRMRWFDGVDQLECGGKIYPRIQQVKWVICGGESGPGARPCDVNWIRSVVGQCKSAGVPCFVKQLGATPIGLWYGRPLQTGDTPLMKAMPMERTPAFGKGKFWLNDRTGGDPGEWPEDLRVREMA